MNGREKNTAIKRPAQIGSKFYKQESFQSVLKNSMTVPLVIRDGARKQKIHINV